ncbi:MAG: peptidoglycan DD-metalloendopeptidase family protein [Rhodospirillaceae bacterium]|nr:peptidoglycan DD-metalloendopeptidase family protein [Rhodospirillaceae bacterium]
MLRSAIRSPFAAAAVAAAAFALLAAGAGEASAQNERNRLKDVERRIDKGRGRDAALSRQAGRLAEEVRSIRKRVVTVARRLQLQEAATMRVERRLARLENAIRTDSAEFRRNERQFLQIVGALRRIRSNPPGVLAMHFADAQDAIRSTIVLRSLVPRLRARADELRRKVVAHNALRRQAARERKDIAAKSEALRGTRLELATLLGRRTRLLAETRAERALVQRRLARLTHQAETLQDLVANLKRETARPEPGRKIRAALLTRPNRVHRFRKARGKVVAPVSGRLVARFGDRDGFGMPVNGLRFAARTGAQAVAPYDGQIVFAGSFRSYGPILIIAHTDGYHSLIAGLARIDVVNRQWVLAGEPVGIVGMAKPLGARLYLELRQGGRPIDPQPWLAADKRKVDG